MARVFEGTNDKHDRARPPGRIPVVDLFLNPDPPDIQRQKCERHRRCNEDPPIRSDCQQGVTVNDLGIDERGREEILDTRVSF